MIRYRAAGVPKHLGPAAWNALLPPQPPPRILREDINVDFAIIGAGFSGLSAARRLTQLAPKATIALLDAGQIAQAAGGRNSGFMIDLPHDLTASDYLGDGSDQQEITQNRFAIRFAHEAVQEYKIDPNYFDPAGKINGAVSAKAHAHNISYRQHLQKLGEPCELLNQQQMQDITGSRFYQSGLYTPGTVLIQPAAYLRGFAKGLAAHKKLAIYENTPALELHRISGDWRIKTPQAKINAGQVILANNGHLQQFGFEKGRLMHLFLFASISRELNRDELAALGGQSRWGITPSDPMGTTVRRIDSAQGGNRIVVRSCAHLRSNMVARGADLARAKRVHQRKFDQRFPQLAGIELQYQWGGHLCLSRNGVQVVRKLDDNLFSACVQNGLGTTRGTLAGIASAELATGQQSALCDYFTNQERPIHLPPRPFLHIGANLYLRWQEWRARHE